MTVLPRGFAVGLITVWLSACAALAGREPVNVSVVGMEPMASQGMEGRFLVKLRVQNPGNAPLEIDGLSLNLAVRGMDFASGVSAVKTSVPRFGEAVLSVPVTVPATALLRQAWAMTGNREVRKIEFELSGRLGAGPFGGSRFATKGDIDWPPGGSAATKP